MKHLSRLLSSLMVLTLASCGTGTEHSVSGRYTFQLGSDKDTHIGIYMELTDNDYVGKVDGVERVLGKEFDLTADLSSALEGGENSETAALSELEDQDFKIKGYYTVGDDENKNRLTLGTTILDDFFDFNSSIQVPDKFIKNIIYATISKGVLNVYVPVSMKDLAFQLYWYGYRINTNSLMDPESYEELPAEQHHSIGTHPTKEDVETIVAAEKAKGEQDNLFESFRDYHTLSMGLVK